MAERIDIYFSDPSSNRGYHASLYSQSLILLRHEGRFQLDDVRHLHEDSALRTIQEMTRLSKATVIGDWLRRADRSPRIQLVRQCVNKAVLKSALHRCKTGYP